MTPTTPRGWRTIARPLVREDERVAELVGQRVPSRAAGVVAGQLQRVEQLEQLGLVAGLAVLGDQSLHQLRVVAERAREPAQRARPRAERQRPPGRLGRPRARHRRVDVGRGGTRDLPEDLAGGGVLDDNRLGGAHGVIVRRFTMSPVTLTGTQPGQKGRALRIGNPLSQPQLPRTDSASPTTASPPAAAIWALISSEKSRVAGIVSAE